MSNYSLIESIHADYPGITATADVMEATLARRLINVADAIQIDPDDMSGTMGRLIAAAVAGDLTALHNIIAAADLTSSGVLTTLATNAGTNTTQGATLATALVARLTTANGQTIAGLQETVQTASPTTGSTITATILGTNETAYLTPSGTLAELTFALPANANSQVGQILRVFSTQIVTTLTVSSSGLTLHGTAITALAANTAYAWQKVDASTWIRIL